VPTLWAHQTYWVNSSTNVAVAGSVGGYPLWQSAPLSLVLGVGLGGAEPLYVRFMTWVRQVRWALGTAWRLRRLDPERRAVLERTIVQLRSPTYTHARVAVRTTARTLRLNEPAAWAKLSHDLHRKAEWAENTYRHLHACDLTEEMLRADGSTTSNPDRNLTVELAYCGFAARGK
jgi:hypothetical protein